MTGVNKSHGFIIPDSVTIDPINRSSMTNYLIDIIYTSKTPFTIGIYGDWGLGKTTLMKYVENKLREKMNQDLKNKKKPTVIPVWFNAWRYERENQFALMPLLKKIEYAIPEDEFKGLRNAFREAGLLTLEIASEIIPSIVSSNFGNIIGNIFTIGFKNLNNKLKRIDENVIKNTIYFEGLEKIEQQINKINDIRIVIFIDDLDRCSPNKTLEIFESMKAFFDIPGIIYVIGISFEKITELMSIVYKNTNLSGNQYLEKIIQFHISIPEWTEADIIELVKKLTENDIVNEYYKNSIRSHAKLISLCIKKNPRLLKKFLNNFIFTLESYSISKENIQQILVLQVLYLNWYSYYNYFIKRGKELIEIICGKKSHFEKSKVAVEDNRFRTVVNNDEYFTDFFKRNENTFLSISNWGLYSKVIKSLNEKQISDFETTIRSLRKGNIKEFNEKKKMYGSLNLLALELDGLDLRNVDFNFINLSGSNLGRCDLRESCMRNSNLSNVNLIGADLANSDLHKSVLTETKISESNLTNTNLSFTISNSKIRFNNSDLSNANLSYSHIIAGSLNSADLTNSILRHCRLINTDAIDVIFTNSNISYSNIDKCNFSNSNFTGSNLSHSSITNTNFSNAKFIDTNMNNSILDKSFFNDELFFKDIKCEKTTFSDSETNNQEFYNYLQKNSVEILPSFTKK